MAVQTIPAIEDMTAVQRAELMEALWKEMSRRPEEIESPAWHGEELKRREEALKNGTDRFISLEDAEKRIREKTR
jgi:putative addiction module component (TIGR02574 family)